MEVSVNTVSTLTQRAYKKIGVTSQAQLAARISGHAREKLDES
jgi:DNA-binding CsgD family transcriptional regulator